MSDTARTPSEIRRFADADEVARAAASAFVDAVVAAQRERVQAHVVLTGGGTGIAMLEHVRRDQGAIDWSAVNVYFGDERFLPPGDPDRNEVQARGALLDHVPIDPARIHTMPALGEDGCSTPEDSAQRYAELLAAHSPDGTVPVFDVHLLGMGGEGHINSLFPHTDAVRESERFVVGVDDSPKPPPARVTLTLPACSGRGRSGCWSPVPPRRRPSRRPWAVPHRRTSHPRAPTAPNAPCGSSIRLPQSNSRRSDRAERRESDAVIGDPAVMRPRRRSRDRRRRPSPHGAPPKYRRCRRRRHRFAHTASDSSIADLPSSAVRATVIGPGHIAPFVGPCR
ncbi:6-phosphogluconolactonase [Rhodococcus pyridinivorans AK37]|uniref:6-phosphogluconolactonase n=1 Tax=Rhodococcus pyridinivorans AK37 TaxID=1114960 RepID=H0JPF3_9NOCA|nr:6-phosphogluconolactonase [Rhodococcus pyridinivorans AK37]